MTVQQCSKKAQVVTKSKVGVAYSCLHIRLAQDSMMIFHPEVGTLQHILHFLFSTQVMLSKKSMKKPLA